MYDRLPRRPSCILLTSTLALGSLALLSACGGGSDTAVAAAPAAAASGSATIAGTVAVGAPISGGTLRVLDASGAVVAAAVPIDAAGRYNGVTLSGTGPYRLEACGYAGADYRCVYSVATSGESGTVNVTPLTTATVLLAAGQSPDALMSGSAPALTSATVASAQTQLRTGLAGVLASAGVASTFDFVSGELAAGSRSGYDGVLDAVGVNVGQDTHAFVQITPRLGAGNLYLEQGTTLGVVTAAAGASSLQLGGLETLFRDMSRALASAAACSDAATGLRHSMASGARFTMGSGSVVGPDAVAAGLCGFFGSGEDGQSPMWGSTFMSPTLGRCDLSSPTAPICAASFALRDADGNVQPISGGVGVTREAGVWKFVGDLLPISIQASARAQRTVRVDSATPVVNYDRAFAFEIAAVPGLACAKVAQHGADGAQVVIGIYKRHPDAVEQISLSLWTRDGYGNGASIDPASGATRSGDDTWLALPEGAVGDAFVRNFYRGGRNVTVALFGDLSCTVPFAVAGSSAFEVEVEGVPPIWTEMPNLAWPELDTTTRTALLSLAIDSGATGRFTAGWTFARGPLGLNGATVCGSRGDCGRGGLGRIGDSSVHGGALTTSFNLRNRGDAIAADSQKTLALYGRSGEGVGIESNYSTCPSAGSGESCH